MFVFFIFCVGVSASVFVCVCVCVCCVCKVVLPGITRSLVDVVFASLVRVGQQTHHVATLNQSLSQLGERGGGIDEGGTGGRCEERGMRKRGQERREGCRMMLQLEETDKKTEQKVTFRKK